MIKKTLSVCTPVSVLMSVLIFAMPILAQQTEIMKGKADGEQMGKSSVNGFMWMAIGCVAGLLGVIIAYIYEPNPPATMLLGKSPEYVASFTDAYKASAKSSQTKNAWIGCLLSGALSILYYAALLASVSETE